MKYIMEIDSIILIYKDGSMFKIKNEVFIIFNILGRECRVIWLWCSGSRMESKSRIISCDFVEIVIG